MISVYGIGWVDHQSYGSVRNTVRVCFQENSRSALKEIFLRPFRNFGRLDTASRVTCCAIGLALRDAGTSYPLRCSVDAGIVGTSATGCLDADLRYFKDYAESGRTLGRGNLFIYTLPSSPLGEAAIHFGLKGTMLYVGGTGKLLGDAVSIAAGIIRSKEASIMFAGEISDGSALYMALADEPFDKEALCSIEQAIAISRRNPTLQDIVREFEVINKEQC